MYIQHCLSSKGTIKDYQIIRQIGLNPELKNQYNVRRNDGSFVGRTKIKINFSDSNNPPSRDQITQSLGDWNTDRQADSNNSKLSFIPLGDKYSKGQFYLVTPTAKDLDVNADEYKLQHQELITEITSNTFSYGENLSFTVEEINLTDATDIATFSLLIPNKAYFSSKRIIKLLFSEEHFTQIAIKQPTLPAMTKFGSDTKFFNIQVLMQVKRNKSTRIPNRKPFMLPHYRKMLTEPEELVDFQDINISTITRMSFCRFCRSTEHPTTTCQLANECSNCHQRGHHHLNCKNPKIFTQAEMDEKLQKEFQEDAQLLHNKVSANTYLKAGREQNKNELKGFELHLQENGLIANPTSQLGLAYNAWRQQMKEQMDTDEDEASNSITGATYRKRITSVEQAKQQLDTSGSQKKITVLS
ncbi:unnamed protein product [Ambrosiozyma monospora]|uniref:Unnamed protein product n=1 Tax=Ambrosiozyma monospora TaxID=43982 RepID=A0ACB5SSX3_AMBMO|nr:unnamed protein product [Ambrosiozyma monospora]